ncbi:hypothetical protein C8R45DRAFT_1171152 [Mycena sanguinolenta]|nr:hypothetical protein C8R45DRAFT_1171152 [Mycena sanguinolenta]
MEKAKRRRLRQQPEWRGDALFNHYWRLRIRAIKGERERERKRERARRHASLLLKWRQRRVGRDREKEGESEREQERRKRDLLLRRVQLTQMLEAPPEGHLFALLLSLIFIMLAVFALELIGWFIFLGLLITILVYLLLIISFMCDTAGEFNRAVSGRHRPARRKLCRTPSALSCSTVDIDISILYVLGIL